MPTSYRGCTRIPLPSWHAKPPPLKREQAGERLLPQDLHRRLWVHRGSRLLVIATGRERGTEPGKQEVTGR